MFLIISNNIKCIVTLHLSILSVSLICVALLSWMLLSFLVHSIITNVRPSVRQTRLDGNMILSAPI